MLKTPIYKGKEYKDYLIDENGNIFNHITKKELKPWIINSGYKVINLYEKGSSIRVLLHRLVANTFIGEIPPKYTVNHIDGNKLNNNVNNLEIITFIENVHHAVRTGLMTSGEDNYNSKYTNEQVHEACRLISLGKHSLSDIAEMVGIGYNRLCQIYHGDKWKNISKHYDFSKPLPVGGSKKREPFSLKERLIIYKLWDLGYSNKEITCILHYPKTQKIYAALWDLKRSTKRKIEPEKFNDYPTGFVFFRRSEDMPIVQLARKKGLDADNNPKQKE